MSYLLGIETANPGSPLLQDALAAFYANAINEPDLQTAKKINILARKSGIKQRYSVISDYSCQPEDFTFFARNRQLEPMPGLSARMALYKQKALQLSLDAISKLKNFSKLKQQLTHIITVTCTGMFAPGNDIDLINELKLNPTVSRSGINFMGCNAAIIALRQADTICKADSSANVLIVCTELCSIHFQKRYNDDYILSNLIFGDGAAAVLVSGKPSAHREHAVQISRFDSMLVSNGYNDMAWQLSETGFIMNLSSYVSAIIKENMQPLFDAIGLKPSEIRQWAIHPGGKKILDDVAAALHLNNNELVHSYKVLSDFGNMSSPTVLFVLKQVIEEQEGIAKGHKVFTAAFGPGLSIETMQLQYV